MLKKALILLFLIFVATIMTISVAVYSQNTAQFIFDFNDHMPEIIMVSFIVALIVKNLGVFEPKKKPQTAANLHIDAADIINGAELAALEKQRQELNKLIKKATFISIGVAGCIAAAMSKFFDMFWGIASGFMVYGLVYAVMTSAKMREFSSNFKTKITKSIVRDFGLSYNEKGSLSINDFFEIYDCEVDEYYGEDLISGEVEGVNVKFSDFCAIDIVKTQKNTRRITRFEGILFAADFNKRLNSVTYICHKDSSYLIKDGERAKMDNVEFERFYDVYTSDQINARYALTPNLMQQILALQAGFDCPVNIVLSKSKILMAIDKRENSFEPDLNVPLTDNGAIRGYIAEIASFVAIVKELNLNRKIWKI
ncbi:DUF3137 domain-containing protein [Campylobacter curvus]|uniref:Hypothetical membrane protein (DUF3137 domain) n=1 Tax=Campylobacter curvus (strain 525.92) TaxID=360105 RepID=A7H0N9_CAMC5|nr:DUF3137 domain-containing protein [Campylobacter curvus]EAU01414.1 hypothetical membrane protein (DUF3137 domain) [Campylobacter curvus 525.92]